MKSFLLMSLIDKSTKTIEFLDVMNPDDEGYQKGVVDFAEKLTRHKSIDPYIYKKTFEWDEERDPVFDFLWNKDTMEIEVEQVEKDSPVDERTFMRYRLSRSLTGKYDEGCGCSETITIENSEIKVRS